MKEKAVGGQFFSCVNTINSFFIINKIIEFLMILCTNDKRH